MKTKITIIILLFFFQICEIHSQYSIKKNIDKSEVYSYNDNGHIYASVQGEKLIQVFNSNYELVDSIQTKLYPLFPMPYSNGLHSIGSYNPVDYWGYYYGYEFNFNQRCAIETF